MAKEVYKNNKIDEHLLRKRIIDLAYINPGLIFTFNGEKYLYKKGLYELAQRIDPKQAQEIGNDSFDYDGESPTGKKFKGKIDLSLSVTTNLSSDERERMISFVNSTPTYDGGFHHDRIRRLFVNILKEKLDKIAKKDKVVIVDNDVLSGMTFIIGITMPNPRFESQTKRKLVRDAHLEKAIEGFMEKAMGKFMRNSKEYMEVVVERAKSRHKFQELKDASKLGRKQKRQRVEKLLDANERRDRSKCILFICEGDSAIGSLRSSRNKLYQGGIALKGKPMNVMQATIKDVLENQEFADIMASVGLVIGEKPDPEKMRYNKIVFLADSDVDGGHINTLLTNFFFSYWPELFSEGRIQIAKAPLFEVKTDQGTIYAETNGELEEIKKRPNVKVREIQRNKGLGEMSPEAFKHLLSRKEFTRISVDDMNSSKKILETCFGKDTNLRKDLLVDDSDPMEVIKEITKEKKVRKA